MLPVTVLIAAKNEESNIARSISALAEFARVIVVDSQSSDSTASVAASLGAEVVTFHYLGGYPKKRQWAMDTLDIRTPWTLLLDADEVATPEFVEEVRAAIESHQLYNAYFITKGFHFLGRRIRFGGFSHSAISLFRTGQARFEHMLDESGDVLDMEVHERLIVQGSTGKIRVPLVHEDFKGLQAYIERHNKYSTWEAKVRFQRLHEQRWGKLSIMPKLFGNAQERRRFLKTIAIRIPFEPWLWFLYHYVLRLGFLEGRPGLIASQIRSSYIAQARAKLYELCLAANRDVSQFQSSSQLLPIREPDDRRKAA